MKNQKHYIIYISFFLFLIFLLYLLPTQMDNLFTSLFGILFMLFLVFLINIYNSSITIGLLMILIIISISIYLSKTKEGFENKWSDKLIRKFLNYQDLHNPDYYYDINIIQQQVTPKEVKEYFKTGHWIWSPEIENVYIQMIKRNTGISFNPPSALEKAKRIYNEKAITDLLAWNTKEGQFIINGAIIGHNDKLPKNINNLLQCNTDGNMVKVIKELTPIQSEYMIENKTNVKPEDIPSLLPGFKFLEEPCNPCNILNEDVPNYNCKFSLDIGDKGIISPIWAYLWGINIPREKKNKFNVGVKSKIEYDPTQKEYNIYTNV